MLGTHNDMDLYAHLVHTASCIAFRTCAVACKAYVQYVRADKLTSGCLRPIREVFIVKQ